MPEHKILSISEFAKFSRTTRDTLLYYDRIGLLSPVSQGENKYRHYTIRQLAAVNMIRTSQALGMTLDEIKDLKEQLSPELVNKLLSRQIEKIDGKIEEWVRARKLLLTLQKSIQSVLNIDEKAITIKFMSAEAIVLGDLNDYGRGKNAYDALIKFYNAISAKYPKIDLNYSVWGFFSEERIKKGDWIWPDRYYFYNPEGHDVKPAAMYAVGYTRGGYGQSDELYKRLIDFIDKNGFEICGPAYEEYPLNEICVPLEKDYLMRVMITVREKKDGE